MLSTTAAYLSLSKNLTRRQAAIAAQADVKSATAYYLKHIGKVSTVGQFVSDHRLFSYAMKAYGLEDKIDAKALIAKVLNGGITDSKALANTLSDPRYKVFAAAFDFAKLGAKATQATSATTGATARYVEQTLEDAQAKTAPGVADALYFKRNAASVTSVYGLLADTTMLNVVETAYGISSTLSQTDVDTQATVLAKVVKVSDFKDAGKVEKLVERYTSAYDAEASGTARTVLLADTQDSARSILSAANHTGASAPAGSVQSLFDATGSGQGGVGSSLLLSLAKLKKGG